MTVIIRKQKVKHMGYPDQSKVEMHLKNNGWAQYVMGSIEKGVDTGKINKALDQAKARILQYGAIDEDRGVISSRFTPINSQDPQLQELRNLEVAKVLLSCKGSDARYFYSKLSSAMDGKTPTGHRTVAGQHMLRDQNAEKDQKRPRDKFTVTTKIMM